MRDALLRGVTAAGAATVLVTELLSPAHLFQRGPIAVFWILVLAWGVAKCRGGLRLPRLRQVETCVAAAVALIAGAIATAAWVSPPNSADTMAYHLPRVIYWAQNGSVAFFPTPYYNQVMLGPAAEYFMLHSYLLTGGDRFINLLTFGAWVVAVAGVSSLAGAMGLGSRGQAFAALFAATLPNGILQASGAKNDVLLALWLVALAYFSLRRDWVFAGLALGLALLTKGTAFLFAPPILLATLWPIQRRAVLLLAAGALLINTPQWGRNVRLSGSPLGCDGAFCNGTFRWKNESFGWKTTVSNALRNGSEQLGGRSERRNRQTYDLVVQAHQALGIAVDDPGTTWPGTRYEPPRSANHEANANNRWHLAIAALAAAYTALRRRWRWVAWAAALGLAFLLFCFYLKWQPFMSRLLLPVFVLSAPLGGFLLDSIRPNWLAVVPCVFLVSIARLPALENWTRPLQGANSLFQKSRQENYFRDMVQWGRRPFLEAIERVPRDCDLVTIDISRNQLEYPIQALLRERNPRVRFQHYGPACATICIECEPAAQ